MTDPKPGYICVYNLTSSTDDAIIEALNRGQFENPPSHTIWSSPQHHTSDQTPSAIVAHHRRSPGILDKKYFIICDRADWADSCVLAVNLDFQGWEDAVRMKVGLAGDAIPSMCIGNTEWEEYLGGSGETWPSGRFAVYVTMHGAEDPEALVDALNAGLGRRKAWTMGGPVCRDATDLLPKEPGADLGTIAKLHASVADKEGLDPSTFLVSDDKDWESVGVSIVRSKGQDVDDICMKSVNCAAEILTWVDQGLYTWDEGKNWNGQE